MPEQLSGVYWSPYGAVELWVEGGKLIGVRLCRGRRAGGGKRDAPPALRPFCEALDRYFRREEPRVAASRLALPAEGTFRRSVFETLLDVPFGRVVTYGELAERTGRPGAARAVGQAVGGNRLPIFVPCHRVVAAGLRLGGFGAGPAWKRDLLTHEGWTIREDKLQ